MQATSSPHRFRFLLIGVLITELAAVAFVVRGSGPAAAAECATETSGSANCFLMCNDVMKDDSGEAFYFLGTDSGSWHPDDASVSSVDGAISWQLQFASDDKSFRLKNLNSQRCLQASLLKSGNSPATLVSCPGQSQFKFAPVNGSPDDSRVVSVDTPGYCLETLTSDFSPILAAQDGTLWLRPCGDAVTQQWHLSGPATGTGAGWAKSIAMQSAFLGCADAKWTCDFRPDDHSATPQLTTKSTCLVINGGNPVRNPNNVPTTLSAAYGTTASTTQTFGSSFDQSVGLDALLGSWGISASVGWGYSSSESYTHAQTDTSTYSLTVPPGMWGWFGSKEFTAVATGTWSFDIGTSYEWSDHESNYAFPDLSGGHPYGHIVKAGVGSTKPANC